jgi:hypothetical protein
MSTRTSKADKNFFSLDAQNAVWFAGTDEWCYETGPIPTELMPENPQDWDAILKTSNRSDTYLKELRIAQGRENALDQNNRTRDCSFQGDFGVGSGPLRQPNPDQVITTKGGSHDIVYSGTIWSKGRNADVVVGAWSDQSHDISTDLDYSGLSRVDGQPVTFILSRCARVKLPPNAKVLRLKSLGYSIYWWAKFAAVKLHLLPSK